MHTKGYWRKWQKRPRKDHRGSGFIHLWETGLSTSQTSTYFIFPPYERKVRKWRGRPFGQSHTIVKWRQRRRSQILQASIFLYTELSLLLGESSFFYTQATFSTQDVRMQKGGGPCVSFEDAVLVIRSPSLRASRLETHRACVHSLPASPSVEPYTTGSWK